MFPALRFPATVEITLQADDTAVVATSGADPGTGLLTVLSLVGAESLDIPPDRITPRLGDSPSPPGGMSGGSTATASVGTAIMVAAAEAIDELLAWPRRRAHRSKAGGYLRRRPRARPTAIHDLRRGPAGGGPRIACR